MNKARAEDLGGMQGHSMHRAALEIFRGLASTYDRVLALATLFQDRRWKDWMASRARASKGEKVLDIGIGTCIFEERLEGSGCEVVGIDLTEQMIRSGKSKGLNCVRLLVRGDAEFLPFPDNTFDLVVSAYVPKYVELGRFTDEVYRVLKVGGRVVLYDFVRPQGLLYPLLALYLHGLLRPVGRVLKLVGSDSAATFLNLPRIVEGATWQEELALRFGGRGVRPLDDTRLSGGVVGAFSGVKMGRTAYIERALASPSEE